MSWSLQQKPERASEEAIELLQVISLHLEELAKNEYLFVRDMLDKWNFVKSRNKFLYVSAKQLYWLRDIRSRFV